jgi:hypothetical protein
MTSPRADDDPPWAVLDMVTLVYTGGALLVVHESGAPLVQVSNPAFGICANKADEAATSSNTTVARCFIAVPPRCGFQCVIYMEAWYELRGGKVKSAPSSRSHMTKTSSVCERDDINRWGRRRFGVLTVVEELGTL